MLNLGVMKGRPQLGPGWLLAGVCITVLLRPRTTSGVASVGRKMLEIN